MDKKLDTAKQGSARATDTGRAPPPRIPDYELLRCIGAGAYGRVWIARNVMGTYRAVKIVYRRKFEDEVPYEREFRGIRKFEAVAGSHPGLLNIFHVGKNDEKGYFYYVMELADDEVTGQSVKVETYRTRTLSSELERQDRLPLGDCIQLGLSLTSALKHLHDNGLIHRDIKPSNIVFIKGIPKLADIGLVTTMGNDVSIVGSPGYMPIEGPGGPTGDLYSLGKLLYVASTGKRVADFPESHTMLGASDHCEEFMRFTRIILTACEMKVSARYQTAQAMFDDLQLLQPGGTGPAGPVVRQPVPMASTPAIPAPPKPGGAVGKSSTSRLGRVAIGLALLGILLIGGWLVIRALTQ